MYSTVFSAFSDALKREGKTITSYSDNTPYSVIFRRNSDTNKLKNTITVFYNANSGVRCGQLLVYKDNTYIAINQETSENDVYLKSDLLQTNATLNFISGNTEYKIPAYAFDVNDALVSGGSIISVVNGSLKLIVEDTDVTRALKIDDKFYSIGGWWEINNLIYKDDIIYIYVKRDAAPIINYTVTINAADNYLKGSSVQFTAVPKANDTTIINATIKWTSSDMTKATVDAQGVVTFHATGDVNISALWQEHNVTTIKTITIENPPAYELIIHADNTYAANDSPTITATASINGMPDTTAIIEWISSDLSIATIDETGKVTFFSAGTVTFTAIWAEHDKQATRTVVVTKVSSDSYTMTITYSGNPEIKVGGSAKSFTIKTYINDIETTFPFNWELLNAQDSWLTTKTLTDNVIRIQAKSDNTLIGKVFQIHVWNIEYNCADTKDITIVSLY